MLYAMRTLALDYLKMTTFDQLLHVYARSKHQIGWYFDLPAGSIANSVKVYEEAHLHSTYTQSF